MSLASNTAQLLDESMEALFRVGPDGDNTPDEVLQLFDIDPEEFIRFVSESVTEPNERVAFALGITLRDAGCEDTSRRGPAGGIGVRMISRDQLKDAERGLLEAGPRQNRTPDEVLPNIGVNFEELMEFAFNDADTDDPGAYAAGILVGIYLQSLIEHPQIDPLADLEPS